MAESDAIDGREERGDRTALALLRAARATFARRGFDGASVRDIAKKANVHPALIRYHFGSKGELYDRVVRDALVRLRERLQNAVSETSETPLHLRLLHAYMRFLDEDSDFQRLVLRAIVDNDSRLLRAANAELGPLFQRAQPTLAALGRRSVALQDGLVSLLGAATVPHIYAPLLEGLTGLDWRGSDARARRLSHLGDLAEQIFSRMGAEHSEEENR